MTSINLPTIEAGSNREIRFEIDHVPVRVSMRLWTSLKDLEEKVPTGSGITLDAERFCVFEQAVHKIAQSLGTPSTVHE